MREIRTSGSEGGGAGNSTGSPYPYQEEHTRGLADDDPKAGLDWKVGGLS